MGTEVTRVVTLGLICESDNSAPPGCPEFHILSMSIDGDNSFLFPDMPALPLPLTWGTPVLISIAFRPQETRSLEAALTLQTNIVNIPNITILLQGRGMACVRLPILLRKTVFLTQDEEEQ